MGVPKREWPKPAEQDESANLLFRVQREWSADAPVCLRQALQQAAMRFFAIVAASRA